MGNIVEKTIRFGQTWIERGAPFAALGFFLGLDLVPHAFGHTSAAGSFFAENVRMTADHLVGDGLNHIAKIERLELLGHASVEDDLQQKIAEFLTQIVDVVALDGIDHFERLLERVRRDGFEILLQIPGAARYRRPQGSHDIEQAGYVA